MAASDMSDLIGLLRFSGHYFSFEGHPREDLLTKLQVFRLFFMVSCNGLTLSSLFMGGISNGSGIELFFGLMGFLTAIQHVYLYVHRRDTEDIIRCLKRFRKNYQPDSDDEFRENTEIIWKVVHVYFYAMTGLVISYLVVPRIADLVYGLVWGDPVVHFRLPMSMDAFFEKRQLRNLKYFVGSLTVIMWSSMSTYSHFGLDSFFVLVGFYYSSIVQSFCSRLHVDTEKQSDHTTRRIKTLAAQQRDLHQIALKIRGLFGFPYALKNMFGSFCNVSLLYALLSDDSGSVPIMVAIVFSFMILTGMLTCTAYVGQHITDTRLTIFESLYDMPWYELRPQDRKYFISMVCAAREPFTIHYHDLGPLNFANFMAILNTTYSYFMFMKSML